MLKTNRGEGKFGIIVILAIVAAVVYVGFKWGYASWDAAEFREQLNQSVIYWTSHGTPTRQHAIIEIMQKAEASNIDLYRENIEIKVRNEGKFMLINIYWETPLSFPFDYTYYLPFTEEREVQRN
jgi:hypothetical protein